MNNADTPLVITWDYDKKDDSHLAAIDVNGWHFNATIKRYFLDYRWWLHGYADGHASSVDEAKRKVEDAINEAVNLR